MLVEHRVDDVDERLVARDESVPSGEQVALQHPLHEVLAERLDDPARAREVLVERMQLGGPRPLGDVEHRAQPVGEHLVGAEQSHVVGVVTDQPGEPGSEHGHPLAGGAAGLGGDVHRERRGRRQRDRPYDATVRERARAHAQLASRTQDVELGHRAPLVVEELLRPVRAEPRLEHGEVLGVLAHLGERHLVGVERPLDLHAVDDARAGPALRRAQHDRGPARRPVVEGTGRGIRSDRLDAFVGDVDRVGHAGVHGHVVLAAEAAGHEERFVAVAAEELDELGLGDAGEQRRVGDLEAVQVEDRQHRAVGHGVQERVPAPARVEGPGLGLAVADDAGDDEPGVVERRAVGVHERVPQLAALVDRARRLGCRVRRDAAGERELAEQATHALAVGR